MTGHESDRDMIIFNAFVHGYDAGCIDSEKGELLAEATDLQNAFFDLDNGQRRTIALENLLLIVMMQVADHTECNCELCEAIAGCIREVVDAEEEELLSAEQIALIAELDASCLRESYVDGVCDWCKQSKQTLQTRIWSKADPIGHLVRVCKSCAESCAGG